ncbi:MAG: cobalamin biosynthesis protein P47K [Peptococcaceae bacterium]|nr:cobalamin biosynthesis protein P47K [Peptococcaceae bacterium]
MNLILFCGFLGSGKTSLILSLAYYLVGEAKTDKPSLAIIENEIGEVGIDDKVLKSGGYEVKELFAGCICCQLTSDLVVTLNDLHEKYNPRWVIVEATGLAYPSSILGTVKKYGKGIESIKSVTVVDAERWDELTEITPVLVESQVTQGDTVLINKVDLVSPIDVKTVEEHIARINPNADIYKVSANKEIDKSIWRKVGGLDER